VTGTDGKTATVWTLGDGANELRATLSRGVKPDTSVLFHATGTTTLSVLNSCLPGGSGDPINASGKTFAFWFPAPSGNKTVKEIQLFFSSAGKANSPTPYTIQLTAQANTFNPLANVAVTTTANVFLRGNNSENKAVTFVVPSLGLPSGDTKLNAVTVQLNVLTNPDGSTINFNTGPCSPGTGCKPPQGCSVTEVNSLTPYPTGTLYRKSVGIIVRGY
jgi:hypothetical protein